MIGFGKSVDKFRSYKRIRLSRISNDVRAEKDSLIINERIASHYLVLKFRKIFNRIGG